MWGIVRMVIWSKIKRHFYQSSMLSLIDPLYLYAPYLYTSIPVCPYTYMQYTSIPLYLYSVYPLSVCPYTSTVYTHIPLSFDLENASKMFQKIPL